MNGNADNRRDSRFFTGDRSELQEIQSKESLQRFVRHNKKRRRLSRLSYVLIFLVLGTIFVIVCLSVFFKIEHIEVVGLTRYSTVEIVNSLDIKLGESLYSVNNAAISGLSDKFPFISSARIRRKLPDTLVIEVVEDEAAAWCELYGEYFVLSGELRILDRVSEPSLLEGQGLFELRLPEIDSAIVGRRIEFTNESDDEYVTAYLDAVIGSVLYPRITALDLRDKFDLKLICDDLYLVELADGEDLPTKLSATAGVLSQTEAFPEGTPAVIDMADPAVSSAIVSHNADISLDA